MDKKSEVLRRLVGKLSLRFGVQDADVQGLLAELGVIESMEFRYPAKLGYLPRQPEFRTRAKQKYLSCARVNWATHGSPH